MNDGQDRLETEGGKDEEQEEANSESDEDDDEDEEQVAADKENLTVQDISERALLIQHAQVAAALLANRSLAFTKVRKHRLALTDANMCLQCRPDWPKAHWRKASALKAAGKSAEAVGVLENCLDTYGGWVDIDEVGGKWKTEFAREVKNLKKLSLIEEEKASLEEKDACEESRLVACSSPSPDTTIVKHEDQTVNEATEDEVEQEVRYCDIISPGFGKYITRDPYQTLVASC